LTLSSSSSAKQIILTLLAEGPLCRGPVKIQVRFSTLLSPLDFSDKLTPAPPISPLLHAACRRLFHIFPKVRPLSHRRTTRLLSTLASTKKRLSDSFLPSPGLIPAAEENQAATTLSPRPKSFVHFILLRCLLLKFRGMSGSWAGDPPCRCLCFMSPSPAVIFPHWCVSGPNSFPVPVFGACFRQCSRRLFSSGSFLRFPSLIRSRLN